MFYRALICVSWILLAAGLTLAQVNSNTNSLRRSSAENSRSDEQNEETRIGTPENEMIRKRQIEREKKIYQEHLARAHEAGRLGGALQEVYTRRQALDKEDLKQLERLEKLARRIREHFGGDDDAGTAELPATLDAAFTQLKDSAKELDKEVTETPRQAISAQAIVKACEVETLARFLRSRLQEKP